MNAMTQQIAVDRINVLEAQIAQLKATAHISAGLPVPPQCGRMTAIMESASLLFKVSRAEILGESRRRKLVKARAAVSWVANTSAGYSAARIGRDMGRRDHTTILNQLKKAELWREKDDDYRKATDNLLAWFTPKAEQEEAPHGFDS